MGYIKENDVRVARKTIARINTYKHEKLTKLVQEAIGEASVCWEEQPDGRVFDTNSAVRITKQLIRDIERIYR